MPPVRTNQPLLPPSQPDPGPSKPHSKISSRANRQQNTACAPCRKRRVKCDRKEVNTDSEIKPTCTECLQRGFNCIDDVRDNKPLKVLRRGRKIQELEPIYGIGTDGYAVDPEPTLELQAPPPPSALPTLQIPFFKSNFYRRFHVQRPIVDPNEFIERFERHVTRGEPLGVYGQLIAGLLATWAASYGVNASGDEEPHDGFAGVERRRSATNIMVRELLANIDRFSVMRSVSWDGVRVLLLLLPLTEEVQSPADRRNMYQATVLQVYSLSNMSDALHVNEVGKRVDQMVRARIFWYGHVHEGLTNGLKGEKLIFDQDDVDSFRSPLSTRDYNSSLARSHVTNSYTYQYATAPIRLSAACRQVNAHLTGPKAERSEKIDKAAMNRVWTAFADSWEEFESLRSCVVGGTVVQNEDTDRFISGWQIFIFEALNVIREKLKARLNKLQEYTRIRPVDGELSPTVQATLSDLVHLHDIAESRCHDMSGKVLELIKRHINTPAFFEYDASLCRDGVFYAGERIAGEANSAEDVHVCLRALGLMRWGYSKSVQRTERLKAIWSARQGLPALAPAAGSSSSLVKGEPMYKGHHPAQPASVSTSVGYAATAADMTVSAPMSTHMMGANSTGNVVGVAAPAAYPPTQSGQVSPSYSRTQPHYGGAGSGYESRAGSASTDPSSHHQPPPTAPPPLVDSRTSQPATGIKTNSSTPPALAQYIASSASTYEPPMPVPTNIHHTAPPGRYASHSQPASLSPSQSPLAYAVPASDAYFVSSNPASQPPVFLEPHQPPTSRYDAYIGEQGQPQTYADTSSMYLDASAYNTTNPGGFPDVLHFDAVGYYTSAASTTSYPSMAPLGYDPSVYEMEPHTGPSVQTGSTAGHQLAANPYTLPIRDARLPSIAVPQPYSPYSPSPSSTLHTQTTTSDAPPLRHQNGGYFYQA